MLHFWISKGSAATQLRWDGTCCNINIKSFLRYLLVKEFSKSVYICRSNYQKSRVLFFETQHRSHNGRPKSNALISNVHILTGKFLSTVFMKMALHTFRTSDPSDLWPFGPVNRHPLLLLCPFGSCFYLWKLSHALLIQHYQTTRRVINRSRQIASNTKHWVEHRADTIITTFSFVLFCTAGFFPRVIPD